MDPAHFSPAERLVKKAMDAQAAAAAHPAAPPAQADAFRMGAEWLRQLLTSMLVARGGPKDLRPFPSDREGMGPGGDGGVAAWSQTELTAYGALGDALRRLEGAAAKGDAPDPRALAELATLQARFLELRKARLSGEPFVEVLGDAVAVNGRRLEPRELLAPEIELLHELRDTFGRIERRGPLGTARASPAAERDLARLHALHRAIAASLGRRRAGPLLGKRAR